MSYWEIGDDRLRALLVSVRPEGDELDGEEGTPDGERPLDDLIARVVWSVLIEPGDKGAGRLIAAIGSVAAARLVLDGAPASALIDATAGGFDEESATETLDRWRPRRRWEDILRCLEGAIRCGASLVVPTDADWPPSLALLDESVPVLLWARGDRSLLRRPGIAIVGARAATGYGEHVAMELSAALSARDAVIVSGGAYGIDGMAHRAALASGGATVAVLAGGIDRLYPSGHEALLTRIAEQGLLVSEAPCGSAPTKWRFLQRNRLIAALSAATIVVEAGRRSGALSTAHHALQMSLPVGLVPGPITSAASAGCHAFLRDWDATLITGAADAMRLAFGDDGVLPLPSGGDPLDDEPVSRVERRRDPMHTRVLDALRPRRGMTVEETARSSGASVAAVQSALGALELEGEVQLGDDGLWRRASSARVSAAAS
jgi:DNA processing protein